jgi:hypothetical protein
LWSSLAGTKSLNINLDELYLVYLVSSDYVYHKDERAVRGKVQSYNISCFPVTTVMSVINSLPTFFFLIVSLFCVCRFQSVKQVMLEIPQVFRWTSSLSKEILNLFCRVLKSAVCIVTAEIVF